MLLLLLLLLLQQCRLLLLLLQQGRLLFLLLQQCRMLRLLLPRLLRLPLLQPALDCGRPFQRWRHAPPGHDVVGLCRQAATQSWWQPGESSTCCRSCRG
jgi:hypothetical protein